MAKLPSNGISIALVRKTIGVTGKSVRAVCTSEKVNRWSRWKPMHLKNWLHELTEAKVYEGRFGFKWDYNRTLLGQYGANLVPTVFTEDYIKPDGDATKVIEETVENVRLFKRWWNETVPTKNDFNGSNDYGRPTGEAALSNYSPARLSDFANYDHASKPIIYSEKGLVKTDDGYTITLKISRPSDTYGGITPNDFQPDTGTEGATMTTWYIHTFIVSKQTVTTSETTDFRYGVSGIVSAQIGWSASQIEITIPANYISHLLGEWYIFFAVGNKILYYEPSADSWMINSDAIAYPRLKSDSYGGYVYPIENMIYLHRVPDGEGLVFFDGNFSEKEGYWPNDSWYKDGEPNPDFTEVFNPRDELGGWVQIPVVELVGYRGLGYFSGYADEEATLRFVTELKNAGSEGYVSPLDVVKKLSKRAYRCLSLGNEYRDKLVEESYPYLDPPSSGYKGLLRDLPVMGMNTSTGEITQDTGYTASILMEKVIETSGHTYKLHVRIYREGVYQAQTSIFVSQPVSGKNNTVRQYVFLNEVNGITNQIIGLKAVARIWNVSEATTQGYTGELRTIDYRNFGVTSGDTTFIPYLPLYDDIVIGLPVDMQGEDTHAGGYGEGASYYGGDLPIRYSVEGGYIDPN